MYVLILGGMKYKPLSRKKSIIFSNVFCIREKGSVYFNIKEQSSVIKKIRYLKNFLI
jgi:hypothetical protein